MNRRDFIKTAAGIWLSAGTALAQAPAKPTGVSIGKRVLQQSDFTYLGSFKLPQSVGSFSTSEPSRGLTHRYVGPNLRFFTTSRQVPFPGVVYEFNYPGYGPLSNCPTATVVKDWGNIYGDKLIDTAPDPSPRIYGLFWDPIGERLYWSWADTYNSQAPNLAVLGYSTINDGTGVATPVAAYVVGGNGYKPYFAGVTAIPSDFATQYTGGKRLGVGFGGRTSAGGNMSDGPALAAIDPPTGAHLSQINIQSLLLYPFTEYYSRRPGDYTDLIGHRGPFTGPPEYGGWQWFDFIGSAVWIDMPTKHGFMVFPVLGHGNIWYDNSDIFADTIKHWWFSINPADLALVATGKKADHDVIPNYWNVQYPGYSYPFPHQQGAPDTLPAGATFDSTTNRLYLNIPQSTSSYFPTVAVYQVA